MLFKEDWDKTCEHFKAWWGNECDEPLIQVVASKKGFEGLPRLWEWGFARYPLNPERTIACFEDYCSKVWFGGDAYPDLWINLGAGSGAAFLGAEPRYREDSQTVWFETPKSWEELEKMSFDGKGKWWQITRNLTAYVTKRGRGKFLAGITDLGGVTDILASLRGSQNLVIDMFRNAEKVKAISSKILEMWHEWYDELYRISEGPTRGNSAWMGLWCHESWYPIQCDFAAMLSPRLFKELAFPYLKEQCVRLDHTIYHLDGPEEIPHLDALLSIPELDGIQWVPGEGHPPVTSPEWLSLYRKILEGGKRLVLLDALDDQVPSLLKVLKRKGLLIRTYCTTEDKAQNLLKTVGCKPR
jgi:5-methyltetrahydrofolate--homocysteine methyltransferase